MKYRLTKRANPQDRSKTKWYAAPINEGKITKISLSKDVVAISSLSRGDVSNVIETFIEVIPKYLLMGKSVSLGELGTLRISFTSEGIENPDEFSIGMIKGAKILFTPGIELKKSLADLKYEKGE
ncbi:MAG: HU family DNA-binding protein [Bacteroidales bacterium]|jgi:predicted histone-like DNA-binding protein|nr:HU family DNA-binding protein [Bacteroidales bacterium]